MHANRLNRNSGKIIGAVVIAGAALLTWQPWDDHGPETVEALDATDADDTSLSPSAKTGAAEPVLLTGLRQPTFEEADDAGEGVASPSTRPSQEAARGESRRMPRHDSGDGTTWPGERAAWPETEDSLRQYDSGQQGAVKIPLRADPGIEHLSSGEGEPDADVRKMPAPKLEDAYRKLASAQEREQFLAELMASERANLPKILAALFASERDPAVKESILSAAADAGGAAQFRGLLTAALDVGQAVDVRLAALYYASDNAPDLVAQYVNDANLDVREEARNLLDTQSTQ